MYLGLASKESTGAGEGTKECIEGTVILWHVFKTKEKHKEKESKCL